MDTLFIIFSLLAVIAISFQLIYFTLNKKFFTNKVLVVSTISILVLALFCFPSFRHANNNVYAQDAKSLDIATQALEDLDTSKDYSQSISDFQANFVSDTSYVLEIADRTIYGQSYYMTYIPTGEVVFCIDPLTTATKLINSDTMFSPLGTKFEDFDSENQVEIKRLAHATMDTYNQTGDVQDLVAGQLLVWQAAGAKVDTYSDNLDDNIANVKSAEDTQDQVSSVEYYDTNGQDLVGTGDGDNGNGDGNVESGNAPVIESNDSVYVQINTSINNAIYSATASDIEDGDLTSSIVYDNSQVDVTHQGKYIANLSVTDSDNNTASKSVEVLVGKENPPVDSNSPIIVANDASYIYQDGSKTASNVTKELLNAYGYDIEDGIIEDVEITSIMNIDTNTEYVNTSDVLELGMYDVDLYVEDTDANPAVDTVSLIVNDEVLNGQAPIIISNEAIKEDPVAASNLNAASDFDAIVYDPDINEIVDPSIANVELSEVVGYSLTDSLDAGEYEVRLSSSYANTRSLRATTADKMEELYVVENGSLLPNSEYIYADGIHEVENGTQLSDEEIISMYNAFAISIDSNLNVSDIYNVEVSNILDNNLDVKTDRVFDENGVYEITFVANSGALSRISYLIVSDSGVTLPNGGMYMFAMPIVTNEDTMNGTNPVDLNDEVNYHAFAYDIDNDVKVDTEVVTSTTSMIPNSPYVNGVYDVTITTIPTYTANSGMIDTNVVILPGSEILPSDGSPILEAVDLEVSADNTTLTFDSSTLTPNMFGAYVYDQILPGVINNADAQITITSIKDSSNNEVNGDQLASGVYTVTLSSSYTNADGQSAVDKVVTLTVTDPTPEIEAIDAIMHVGDDASLIDSATFNAQVLEADGSVASVQPTITVDLSSVSVDASNVLNQTGIYDVTLSTVYNGFNITEGVKLAVVPAGVTLPTSGVYVYANDGYLQMPVTDASLTEAIETYNAFGYDIDNNAVIDGTNPAVGELTIDASSTTPSIDITVEGLYTNVSVSVTSNISMLSANTTVDLLIGDETSPVDGNNPIIVSKDSAYLYQDGSILSDSVTDVLYNAFGYDIEDGVITPVTITHIMNDLTMVDYVGNTTDALPLGEYTIALEVLDSDSNVANKTVTLTVGNMPANGDKPMLIGYSAVVNADAITNVFDVATIDVSAFNSHVYDPITGLNIVNPAAAITFTMKDASGNAIDTASAVIPMGVYDVTLSSSYTNVNSDSPDNIDVKLYVVPSSITLPITSDYIYADSYHEQALDTELSDEELIILYNAYAYNYLGGLAIDDEITTVSVLDPAGNAVSSGITGKYTFDTLGVYSVTFTTASGQTITSDLVITNTGIELPTSGVYIYSEPIVTNEDVMSSLSPIDLTSSIEYKAWAYDVDNAQAVAIASAQPQDASGNAIAPTTRGIYESKITASDASATNVMEDVVILPDTDTIDAESPYLYAEDAYLSKTYTDLTKPTNPLLYNAWSYDMQDGDLTSDVIVQSVKAVGTSTELIDSATGEVLTTLAEGDYDVVLSVTDLNMNTTTKDVVLHVTPLVGTITAHDAAVVQSTDVSTLSADTTFGATAQDSQTNPIDPTTLSMNTSRVDTSHIGVYPVLIYTQDPISGLPMGTIVKLGVYPTGTVLPTNGVYVYAQDGYIDVNNYLAGSEEEADTYSAWGYDVDNNLIIDGTDPSIGDLTVDISSTTPRVDVSTQGLYSGVIVTATNGVDNATQTVDLLVGNETTPADYLPIITAKTPAYLQQTGSVTSSSVTPGLFEAYGYDIEDGVITETSPSPLNLSVTKVVNNDTLEDYLDAANSASPLPLGEYTVTIKVSDSDSNIETKDVTLVVGDLATAVPVIKANNNVVAVGTNANSLTYNSFGSVVYDPMIPADVADADAGLAIEDIVDKDGTSQSSNTSLTIGMYDVEISSTYTNSTGGAANKQVKLYVVPTSVTLPITSDYIYADKMHEQAQNTVLSYEEIVGLYNAYAYNVVAALAVDDPISSIEVTKPSETTVDSTLASTDTYAFDTLGVYKLTFTSVNGQTVSSDLVVTPTGIELPTSGIYLYAKDGWLNEGYTNDAKDIELYSAWAYDVDNNTLITPTVEVIKTASELVETDVTANSASLTSGSYKVSINATDGVDTARDANKDVMLTVLASGEILPPSGDITIYGADVTLASGVYGTDETTDNVNYEDNIGLYNAYAIDGEGNNVAVSITDIVDNTTTASVMPVPGIGSELPIGEYKVSLAAGTESLDVTLTVEALLEFSADDLYLGLGEDATVDVLDFTSYPNYKASKGTIDLTGDVNVTSVVNVNDGAATNLVSGGSIAALEVGLYQTTMELEYPVGTTNTINPYIVVVPVGDKPIIDIPDGADGHNPYVYGETGVIPKAEGASATQAEVTDPSLYSAWAYDVEDKDITSGVTVKTITNALNTSDTTNYADEAYTPLGEYDVILSVTDSAGNVSTREVKLYIGYIIRTCKDLESIGQPANYAGTTHAGIEYPFDASYYVVDDGSDGLANNTIDCTATNPSDPDHDNTPETTYGVDGFDTIGDYSLASTNTFTGTLNGLGNTIDGVYIYSSSSGTAVFGALMTGGVIKNIGVTNINYYADHDELGGLVVNNKGTISNSYTTGNITSTGKNVGGLADNNSGTISNSYSTVDVTGSKQVGGLAYMNTYGSTITNSYATGDVILTATGQLTAGGLAGFSSGEIRNSYATGDISFVDTGTADVGVLVGNQSGTVTNSYRYDGATCTGCDNLSGTPVSSASLNTDAFYKNDLLWNSGVWTRTDGNFPQLVGISGQVDNPIPGLVRSEVVSNEEYIDNSELSNVDEASMQE